MHWGPSLRLRFRRNRGGADSWRSACHLDIISMMYGAYSWVWANGPPRVNFLNLLPLPRPAPGGPPGAMVV